MQKTIGSYRLIDEISSGGMGRVYKAIHTSLERTVAIKMIHPELLTDSRILENFYNEARIQAKLNHPNIATVYDFFQDANKHFVVMEYVEGESISKIIKHIGPFDADTTVSILQQILNGIAYAHSKNVIHKDIKTSNFLLTPSTVKIIDFGIAQILDDSTRDKRNSLLLGTPNYMSPEQISGEAVDKRTDIYSLGIVLYEFLTGNVPYDVKDNKKDLIREGNAKPVTDYNPDIPERLVDILNKAIQHDPAKRFQTTEEFLKAVQKLKASAKKHLGVKKHFVDEKEGSLSETTVADIFCSLYFAQKTGFMTINSLEEIKVHFYRGFINFIEYREPSLMLGEMLVKQKKITEQQRDKALDFLHETEKKIGECLVELGKITPHELNDILKEQIVQKIQIALECRKGKYSFKELGEPVSENIYNVYPLQAVYHLSKRGLLQTKHVEGIQNKKNYIIKTTKRFTHETERIKFSSLKEIKFCNVLKEKIGLEESLKSSPLDIEESVNFINFLAACRLITIEQKKEVENPDYYKSLQEDKTVAMSEDEIKELMKK